MFTVFSLSVRFFPQSAARLKICVIMGVARISHTERVCDGGGLIAYDSRPVCSVDKAKNDGEKGHRMRLRAGPGVSLG